MNNAHEQQGFEMWDQLEEASNKVVAEAQRLLRNPTELLNLDLDVIVSIYTNHDEDLLDLGESIHRYFVERAESQAREYM